MAGPIHCGDSEACCYRAEKQRERKPARDLAGTFGQGGNGWEAHGILVGLLG
jgi:hypothetical protein